MESFTVSNETHDNEMLETLYYFFNIINRANTYTRE